MGLLSNEYAGREPSYRLPSKAVEMSLRTKTVRKAFSGAPPESIVYLNHPVRFDTRRANDLLARHGLRVSRCDASRAMMSRTPIQISSGASGTLLASQGGILPRGSRPQ